MTKFELAKKSAEFASMLDDEKNTLQPLDKSIAQWLVNQIHFFAENIAGNRSNEIYCPDDTQTAITEIAMLEQYLEMLKKTTQSFLEWQHKFETEMINPLLAKCAVLMAGQCTCSDIDEVKK